MTENLGTAIHIFLEGTAYERLSSQIAKKLRTYREIILRNFVFILVPTHLFSFVLCIMF